MTLTKLVSLSIVACICNADSLNWGLGGAPFGDASFSPKGTSPRWSQRLDCPKWSRVSTIVEDTVLLTCGPEDGGDHGSIRRYELSTGVEVARFEPFDGRWPVYESNGWLFITTSKMRAFHDEGASHWLHKLDAKTLLEHSKRDVSSDLGLVHGGEVDSMSQINGVLSGTVVPRDPLCEGERLAVGVSGFGLTYGVGSDPHEAALVTRTQHHYGKIGVFCTETLEKIWLYRNGFFNAQEDRDYQVGDRLPETAFRAGHRWRAGVVELACDSDGMPLPIHQTRAIPESVTLRVVDAAPTPWPSSVSIPSGENASYSEPSVWRVHSGPSESGEVTLAPDGANWNGWGGELLDPITKEALGTIGDVLNRTFATHVVTNRRSKGPKDFLTTARRTWSGPPDAPIEFTEGCGLPEFPPSIKVQVERGARITDESARAVLQSWGGSFWFRMASDGARLVTPSGDASTESLEQWYALRSSHASLAQLDDDVFDAVRTASVDPTKDHVDAAEDAQERRSAALVQKQSTMELLSPADRAMASSGIIELSWMTGSRRGVVYADGPQTDANNALILPDKTIVATTKAGTLMLIQDGTIQQTILAGETSADPKGADSPGNFGGLCYPGAGDLVMMHSSVQSQTMVIQDRLVHPGDAFVIGVNAVNGTIAWVYVQPRAERAWAVGLTCDATTVYLSNPATERVVGLAVATGDVVWDAEAGGCDSQYNCVEVATLPDGDRLLLTDHKMTRLHQTSLETSHLAVVVVVLGCLVGVLALAASVGYAKLRKAQSQSDSTFGSGEASL